MKRVLASLAVIGIAGAALAHTGATGIVKERMDGMGVLAAAMKKLAGAKNSGVVDANELAAIAQDIQAHSGQALLQRFPEGSLPHVSEASPVIWSDWEGFEAQANLLYEAAVALEKTADTENFVIDASFAAIGATCAGCHKDYRIKK